MNSASVHERRKLNLPTHLASPEDERAPSAPAVVDKLTDLTGYRDRERLDITLVTALFELLRPESVAIWASVGEAGRQRWLKRAILSEETRVPVVDPIWMDFGLLDHLHEHPVRMVCLRRQLPQTTVAVSGGPRGIAQWTVLPLVGEQSTTAVVEIRSDAPLTAEATRMAMGILKIFQNFQSLLDYSEHDTLTGLLNRKTFDDSFFKVAIAAQSEAAELALVAPKAVPSSARPLSVAVDAKRTLTARPRIFLGVIDIDHFKAVNDTYGHLIGDEILLLLSRIMRNTFRYADRLYRFGGEEFLVMMQCANEAEAAMAFERLRANTESYAFPQVGTKTISVGFTEVSATDSPNSAFERADKALYFAKKNGRNQVHSYATLVASKQITVEDIQGDVELF
jgi:diguanylate cyclase (GGDEF)-like protein